MHDFCIFTAPGPPEKLTCRITGDNKIHVKWEPPEYNIFLYPVVGYILQSSSGELNLASWSGFQFTLVTVFQTLLGLQAQKFGAPGPKIQDSRAQVKKGGAKKITGIKNHDTDADNPMNQSELKGSTNIAGESPSAGKMSFLRIASEMTQVVKNRET